MKNVLVVLATILTVGLAQAQQEGLTNILQEIPVPPLLELPLMAPETLPDIANFYSAGREWPPLPFNPYNGLTNVPVYSIATAYGRPANAPFYLFDDRNIVAAEELLEAAEAAQRAQSPAKAKGLPRGQSAPQYAKLGLSPMTDDLQLDIEDATNGVVSLLVVNPTSLTNDPVWDLYATTNLSLSTEPGALNATNWTWLARTATGQTNLLVPMLSKTECYFRLSDTNDVDGDSLPDVFELFVSHSDPATDDTDGDGLLDGWSWTHFGHVYGSAGDQTRPTDDYDGDGTSNLDEQTSGTDPNTVVFTLSVTNQYSRLNPALVQVVVSGGAPSKIAVVVDSTNFASAIWENYTSSNITINLGVNGSWHDLRIGLRGRNETASQTWRGLRIKPDISAPALSITSPASAITTPMIQLRGFSTEPLSSIAYTLGTVTNRRAFILDQHYDTNTFEFTTNSFQAFDLPLILGTNIVTLMAVDLAGNQTTTNFTFTLLSDTNAPTLNFVWPHQAMKLSGTNFTIRGQLDDPTALVIASMIDTNGVTNSFDGLVERDGKFWVENLPLMPGTNTVSLTVVDTWTNVLNTNLTVLKSLVEVSINPVSDSQIWENYVTVSGTVGDTNLIIWVNGVGANITGTNWTANGVSLGTTATANVSVTAYPSGEEPSGGETNAYQAYLMNPPSPDSVNLESNKDKPSRIYIAADYQMLNRTVSSFNSVFEREGPPDGDDGTTTSFLTDQYAHQWTERRGGRSSQNVRTTVDVADYLGNHTFSEDSWGWQKQWLPDRSELIISGSDFTTNGSSRLTIGWEHCSISDPVDMPPTTSIYRGHELNTYEYHETYNRHAETLMKLFNGGKSIAVSDSLWVLWGSIKAVVVPRATPAGWDRFSYWETRQVSNNLVTIGDFGVQRPDGKLYAANVPKGVPVDITAKTATANFYTRDTGGTEPQLTSLGAMNGSYRGAVGNVENYAYVKDPSGYVIVEASIASPYQNDTNVAEQIKWEGDGEAVAGNPFQRRVSKAVSAKKRVKATLGKTTLIADVWIVWADVTVQHSGTKTLYVTNFDFGNSAQFTTNMVGFEANPPGIALGPTNLLNGTNGTLAWKVEIMAKLTPKGVGKILPSDLEFVQKMSHHLWVGNTNVFTAANNVLDTAFNDLTYAWKDVFPDPLDRVFILDAPAYLERPPTPFFKRESNFNIWLEFGGIRCSDDALWWVIQKAETTNGVPHAIINAGGNGAVELSEQY